MAEDQRAESGSRVGKAATETPQKLWSRRRRQEILDVALRTFATRGFHNASLAEIAAEVGMTAAGILHHFKTKDH